MASANREVASSRTAIPRAGGHAKIFAKSLVAERGGTRVQVVLRKTFGTEISWRNLSMAQNPPLIHVDPTSTIASPPSDLGPAGQRLWNAIMTEYDVSDAGGRALLEQIAFAYERAERLRAGIDRDGEIVRGRAGMLREHPGLKGELAARSFICRSLQRLGVNLESIARVGRPSSSSTR
jgi:hypothetical protein